MVFIDYLPLFQALKGYRSYNRSVIMYGVAVLFYTVLPGKVEYREFLNDSPDHEKNIDGPSLLHLARRKNDFDR